MNISPKNKLGEGKFKNIVWDYNMTQQTFLDILHGKKTKGWFTQDWAIARVVENLDYYSAVSLVGMNTLVKKWDKVKDKIFNKSIKRGYEYVLQRQTLSSAK